MQSAKCNGAQRSAKRRKGEKRRAKEYEEMQRKKGYKGFGMIMDALMRGIIGGGMVARDATR